MTPNIKWVITKMKWDPSTGGIVLVRWKVVVSDLEKSAEVSGTSMFYPEIESDSFIPIGNLNENTIISWVKKKTPNYKNTEKRALKKFNNMHQSSTLIDGLPWEISS